MTPDHRFTTYTRLEKAHKPKRILARRMPARQKRQKLQARFPRLRRFLTSTPG